MDAAGGGCVQWLWARPLGRWGGGCACSAHGASRFRTHPVCHAGHSGATSRGVEGPWSRCVVLCFSHRPRTAPADAWVAKEVTGGMSGLAHGPPPPPSLFTQPRCGGVGCVLSARALWPEDTTPAALRTPCSSCPARFLGQPPWVKGVGAGALLRPLRVRIGVPVWVLFPAAVCVGRACAPLPPSVCRRRDATPVPGHCAAVSQPTAVPHVHDAPDHHRRGAAVGTAPPPFPPTPPSPAATVQRRWELRCDAIVQCRPHA